MTPGGYALVLRGSGLTPWHPRALVVAAGIAAGVSLLVGLTSLTDTAASAFRASLEEVSGRADLRISGGEVGFPEAVLEAVRARPEIAVATPLVRGSVFADDDSGEVLEVFGVDLVDDEAVQVYQGAARIEHELEADPLLFLNQADSVMITRELALRRGLRSGDPLRVVTPGGMRRLTVRGILQASGLARLYGGRVLIMDVYGAQVALERRGHFDAIDVVLRDDAQAAAVIAALRGVLPAGLTVARPEERGAYVERMLRSFRALVEASGVLAVMLALFLAYGAAASATAERRRALGILRATGAVRSQVLLLVLGSSAVLGLVGAAGGVLLGLGLARALEDAVLHAFNMQFVLALETGAVLPRPGHLALCLLAGVSAAVAGAVPPAWQATGASVLDTVQARPQRERGWQLAVPLGTALIAVGLGILWREHGAGAAAAAGAGAALGAWAPAAAAPSVAAGAARALSAAAPPTPAAGAAALGLLLAGGTLLVGGALRLGAHLSRVALRCCGARTALIASTIGLGPRRRLTVMVTGLALSVALIVNLDAIHASVEESVAALLARQLRGDLVVSSIHTSGGWVPAPLAGTLEAELAAVPGVARVVTLRSVDQPYGDGTIRLRAVGGTLDDAALAHALVVEGDPAAAAAALHAGTGVLASSNLALHHGIRVGDVIRLESPRGVRVLPVAALIIDLSSERGTITIDRQLYRRWWGDDLVNVFELSVAPGADADAVGDAIARRFGRTHHLQVRPVAEHRRARLRSVRRAFAFSRAVVSLTLLVTLFAFADNLFASVSERAGELATLRALGATRRQIGVLIGEEALFLAIAGGVFGLALGSLIAVAWLRLSLPALIGFVVDFHFPFAAALQAVAAAALVGAAAAWLPARRGAAVSVARVLRGAG